jgi:hypothetical protein
MGPNEICIRVVVTGIARFFYIPEIIAPYLQSNGIPPAQMWIPRSGKGPEVRTGCKHMLAATGTGNAMAAGPGPAVEVVITAAYPVTPITSLCEQIPGARLFSRRR